MNKKNNDKNKNNKNKMMSVTHSSFSHTYIYDKNKIIILSIHEICVSLCLQFWG